MAQSRTAMNASADDWVRQADQPADKKFAICPSSRTPFSPGRIQPIRHNFHAHPLLQLTELAKLANALAATNQCRFIPPDTLQSSAFAHDPDSPQGLSIEEVFNRIEEPGAWVALYNIQTHPTYRTFLAEVVASFQALVEPEQPGIFGVDGFIFISAPPSVTPFHIDRENNFWLQISGRKVMSVWDHTDREAVSASAVDQFIVYGGLEEIRLTEQVLCHSHNFEVGPGDGVYFPSTSPHMTRTDRSWVKPGDGVCVSIGVVFHTEVTRRVAHVHAWNLFLRQLGLSPRDPGHSRWRDWIKSRFGHALIWTKAALRGYRPRVGF